MADYPYTMNPGRLKSFFDHIKTAGVPSRVTTRYLVESGFKSTNDRPFIKILSSLGFIDSAGNPTDTWRKYRDQNIGPSLLGTAMRTTYSDLFAMYPRADQQSNVAISNFFSARTSVGKVALDAMVSTFKTLCSIAEFDGQASEVPKVDAIAPQSNGSDGRNPQHVSLGVPLNINIQLQLPVTDDITVYDKLFDAMKRHLLQRED